VGKDMFGPGLLKSPCTLQGAYYKDVIYMYEIGSETELSQYIKIPDFKRDINILVWIKRLWNLFGVITGL